jgi:hypothetical protein
MGTIEEKKIYAIDGGFFKACYDEEDERFEPWTYEGDSGSVIARTGFEIGSDGALFHRVFVFEAQEHVIFEAGLTVDELAEVDGAEFADDRPGA